MNPIRAFLLEMRRKYWYFLTQHSPLVWKLLRWATGGQTHSPIGIAMHTSSGFGDVSIASRGVLSGRVPSFSEPRTFIVGGDYQAGDILTISSTGTVRPLEAWML